MSITSSTTTLSGGLTVAWTATPGWQPPDDPPPSAIPAKPGPRQPSPPASAHCNCPPCWGGLIPPPACPAHGQTEMIQVRC